MGAAESGLEGEITALTLVSKAQTSVQLSKSACASDAWCEDTHLWRRSK